MSHRRCCARNCDGINDCLDDPAALDMLVSVADGPFGGAWTATRSGVGAPDFNYYLSNIMHNGRTFWRQVRVYTYCGFAGTGPNCGFDVELLCGTSVGMLNYYQGWFFRLSNQGTGKSEWIAPWYYYNEIAGVPGGSYPYPTAAYDSDDSIPFELP